MSCWLMVFQVYGDCKRKELRQGCLKEWGSTKSYKEMESHAIVELPRFLILRQPSMKLTNVDSWKPAGILFKSHIFPKKTGKYVEPHE